MTTYPGTPPDEEEPVGAALKRMRQERRVSGRGLAHAVGLSQSTVSRIERGIGSPAVDDIRRLAVALGADERQVADLVLRAERAHDRMTDWRPTSDTLAGRQESVAEWEAGARVTRDFQPTILPGLLQVSGYARAVLRLFQPLARLPAGELTEAAVLAAVSARMRRQEVLADRSKSFAFIVTEAVLKSAVCPPAEMLAQIHHLREVIARYDNVSLTVVPDGAPMAVPPLHGFTLLDDDLVVIDVYNTGLVSRGGKDVEIYHQIFEMIQGSAAEAGPALERCQAIHVEALRRGL